MKTLLSYAIIGVLLTSTIFAANVSIDPLYEDPRFPPADQLHAGCNHTIDIALTNVQQDIKELYLILSFDPDAIDIHRVLPTQSDLSADYTIEYGRVLFTQNDIGVNQTNILSLFVASDAFASGTSLSVARGSYVIYTDDTQELLQSTQYLSFASVPECDPDVIPPRVTLDTPVPVSSGVALDQHFLFTIADAGKGIDISSLEITINGERFDRHSIGFAMSGDKVMIQPQYRLPVGKEIDISVSVADQQIYGGANVTEKTFTVSTADDIVLMSDITPFQVKKAVSLIRDFHGTKEECSFLQTAYQKANTSYLKVVASLLQKMGCEVPDASFVDTQSDPEISSGGQMIVTDTENTHQSAPTNRKLSVFAVIGRLLFVLVALLKGHYIVAYLKHKKLVTKLSQKS